MSECCSVSTRYFLVLPDPAIRVRTAAVSRAALMLQRVLANGMDCRV